MKKLLYILMLFFCMVNAEAQSTGSTGSGTGAGAVVHDEMLFNQFSSMEVSYGNLTPEWWYKLLNRRYFNNIAHDPSRGMQFLRSQAAIRAGQQVEMADSIDSVMCSRRDVELLNIADRQVDLIWEVEKLKIEPLMSQFRDNINYVTLYGGSVHDYDEWMLIYKSIDDSLTAIHKAYLANSKRHEQYLAIYKDLKQRNQSLISYLQQKKSMKDFKEMTDRSKKPGRPDVKSIARQAHGRWLVAMSGAAH